MKIFCLTDTHGICPESRPDADIALIPGDFSHFGTQYEELFRLLSEWRLPTYFTSGNHESPELSARIAGECGAVCLDYAWTRAGDLLLAGVGGHDLFSANERNARIEDFARRMDGLQLRPEPAFSILLTHEPPFPWKYNGRVRGSERLRNVVRAWPFNLVLTGHFHEDLPRLETDYALRPTLNPTFAGCVIDVDPSRRTFVVI